MPATDARTYSAQRLARMARQAAPSARLVSAEPLEGGLRNSNFKLQLDDDALVLRIYEYEPALCRKELDLHRLVAATVPVPEILHAEPDGLEGSPPFVVMRFVTGIPFRALKATGDVDAIAQASSSIGATLAAIGRHAFEKSGWLAPGPTPTSPLLEGTDPCPRFVDRCLASPNLQRRVEPALRDALHAFVWEWATRLASLDDERTLVHCDFSSRNVLVREDAGRWSVAAVLDWEFAVSASPLIDVGHFLRYERAAESRVEPHFSRAFTRGGGRLPPDWLGLSRALDLTALVDMLARPHLPDGVAAELVALVRATARSSS